MVRHKWSPDPQLLYGGSPPPPIVSYQDFIVNTYFANLVAFWPEGESTPTLPQDVSGNAHHATSGTVTLWSQPSLLPAWPLLTSMRFNGGNRAIVPDTPGLDLGDGPFTLEVWFKRSVIGAFQCLMDKGLNAYQMLLRSDNFLALFSPGAMGTICQGTIAVNNTNAHHGVITYSGTVGQIYIDGVQGSGATSAVTLLNNATNLTLGANVSGGDGSNAFQQFGAIYNRVLTPAEVLANYEKGTVG